MRPLLALLCVTGAAHADTVALERIRTDHGISLAISGMIIVFCGLALISLFISQLPRFLRALEKAGWMPAPHGDGAHHVAKPVRAGSVLAAATPGEQLDAAMLAAVTLVLHAEAERAAGQNLKVTIGLNPSPWALSSNMRVIPGRIK